MAKPMSEIVYPDESYAIMGACFEVYNDKGCGFLEPVYHDCMQIELRLKGIPFVHEPLLALSYKGIPLSRFYSPDFVCWDKIILELKACESPTSEHVAQVLNYLTATGHQLGLLVNFGRFPKLEYKRIARTKPSGVSRSSA